MVYNNTQASGWIHDKRIINSTVLWHVSYDTLTVFNDTNISTVQ